jgi:membrane fusion protein
VKEGDVIERGARVAEIRIGGETATGNIGDLVIAQLRAELDAARTRARTQIDRLTAESEQASARLSRQRAEMAQLQTQADLQTQRLQIARQEVARGEELGARGTLPRAEVERRQSAALGAQQDLASLRRQIGAMERDISDIDARIAAILIEKETLNAEGKSAEAGLEQRMIDAEARRVQVIIAPVAGRVAALPLSIGQPVSVGGTVAVVIPEGARIEAELLAPSRGAGFIRPGQEVRLMLQAFPHQRFGTVKGEVKSISKTVLGPTEISIPGLSIQEPVFRVRVSLPRDDIQAYGEAIPLQPGMLLTADVVVDRRSLIQWLFDPLFAVAQRS